MNTPSTPRLARCATLLLGALTCAACSSPTLVDRQFGMAVRQARQSQSLPVVRDPAAQPGHDAAVVRSGIARYEKSYVMPPVPASTLEQGLGTPASAPPR